MSGSLVQAELAGGRGGLAAAGDAAFADNAGHLHADGLHRDGTPGELGDLLGQRAGACCLNPGMYILVW